MDSNNIYKYEIYNAEGKVFAKGDIEESKIDVAALQPSLYFLKAYNDKREEIAVLSFIK